VTEVVEGYLLPSESAQQHISLMKIGEEGSVQIKLDWREKLVRRNLDLNLLKTEKDGTMESCLTYWHNMEGCKGVTLDQNIGKEDAEEEPSPQRDTLYAKAETITVQDFPSTQDSVFLVYIEDNTASGPDLDAVTPHLTINNGGKSRSIIMPTVPDDSLPGVRYWIAGCFEAASTGLQFYPVNSWTQENPHTNSRLLCVNLLAQQSQDTSSCPGGIAVEVDVVDSEISKPVGNSKVVVLQSKALQGTSITEGLTDGNGRLSLVLEQSGKYLVQVEAAGFVGSERQLEAICSPQSSCSDCAQNLSFSLLKSNDDDQIHVTLSSYLSTKLVAVMARSNCTTDGSKCKGIKQINNKTLSFSREAVGISLVTLYVKFAPNLSKASVEEYSTTLTVNNAVSSQEVTLQASTYSGETYWLAGCLVLGSAPAQPGSSQNFSFQLTPVQLFLSSSMVNATGSRYCLDHSDNAPPTTSDSHKEENERSFLPSWFY